MKQNIINWWYRLVAMDLIDELDVLKSSYNSLDAKSKSLEVSLGKAQNDVKRLEKPTPIGSWIHSQAHASRARIDELEMQLAKMHLLRDALKNEKAYTLFLEDCLDCENPGDVFNALPLEKRKEYFDKIQ